MIESSRLLHRFFFFGGGGGGGGFTASNQRLELSLGMRLCTVQAIGGTNIQGYRENICYFHAVMFHVSWTCSLFSILNLRPSEIAF